MLAYGTHLYRREGTYYFRMSIPKNIQGIFGRCELRRSLDTGNKSRAQARARRAAFELRNLFFKLDGPDMANKPTTQEIRQAVDAVFRRLLLSTEQELAQAPMRLPSALEGEVDGLECDLKLAQEVLAMGGNDAATEWARSIAQEHGWATEAGSPEFAILCREILKRTVDHYRVEIARRKGDYALEGQLFPPMAAPSEPKAPPPPSKPDMTLSALITRYLNDPVKQKGWKGGSVDDVRSTLEHLVFILGKEKPLRSITKSTMRDFVGVLLQMPPNRAKKKTYRGLTAQQIIVTRPEKTLSGTTVNNVLAQVGSLFNYAVELDALPANPASRLTVPQERRADEQRDAFTVPDLNAIFGQPGYSSDAYDVGWKFWVPLLALYTGARLEELCQLHLSDLRQADGVWVLDINEREGKSLKNVQSRRLAPLHDDLLGRVADLPGYAQQVASQGGILLFPELEKSGKDRMGKSVSQFFSRTVKMLGLEGRKSFHSFRHTFFSRLYEAGVGEVDLKKAGGHKVAGETFSRYCKPLSPASLKERVFDRLDFPGLVLGHLARSRHSGMCA